jgi:hypothetical protein
VPAPQVLLCSACSGHGFKMSSAIGEQLARLVPAQGAAPSGDGGQGAGGGGAGIQRAMAMHRLHPDRQGHAAALRLFQKRRT